MCTFRPTSRSWRPTSGEQILMLLSCQAHTHTPHETSADSAWTERRGCSSCAAWACIASLAMTHVHCCFVMFVLICSPCGTINRVTILRNSYGPAGIAYIEFSSTGEACTALALAGSLLLGRPVAVSLKPPQPLAVQPPVVHRPARPVSGPTKLAEAGAKKLSDAAPLRGKMTWRRPSSAPVANGAAPATDTADATDAFEVSHDES